MVESVIILYDGDWRVDVSVDSKYAGSLDTGNTIYQNGLLVVELLPQDQAAIPVPSVGQHITFVGPLVYDTTNRWNAIYPRLVHPSCLDGFCIFVCDTSF